LNGEVHIGQQCSITGIPAAAPQIVRELTERTGLNDFTIQPTATA